MLTVNYQMARGLLPARGLAEIRLELGLTAVGLAWLCAVDRLRLAALPGREHWPVRQEWNWSGGSKGK